MGKNKPIIEISAHQDYYDTDSSRKIQEIALRLSVALSAALSRKFEVRVRTTVFSEGEKLSIRVMNYDAPQRQTIEAVTIAAHQMKYNFRGSSESDAADHASKAVELFEERVYPKATSPKATSTGSLLQPAATARVTQPRVVVTLSSKLFNISGSKAVDVKEDIANILSTHLGRKIRVALSMDTNPIHSDLRVDLDNIVANAETKHALATIIINRVLREKREGHSHQIKLAEKIAIKPYTVSAKPKSREPTYENWGEF
jgi:hypothetical protein